MSPGCAEATSPIIQDGTEEPCFSTSKPQFQDETKGIANESPQIRHTGVRRQFGAHFDQKNRLVDQNYISPRKSYSEVVLGPYQELKLSKIHHSLSFHESSVSRYIHRHCLEYTFHLFMNPAANPQVFYRVFRLVSCIADRSKMQPYFKNLLSRSSNESLEISRLPFYTIGGAGTHFTRKDSSGQPIFPSNTRLPKRILGSPRLSGTNPSKQEKEYTEFLEMRGYGGIWFDSYEVERYLMEKGLLLNSSYSLRGTGQNIEYPTPNISLDPSSSNTTISNISTSTTTVQSWANGGENLVHSSGEIGHTHSCDQLNNANEDFDEFILNTPSSFFDIQRFLDCKLTEIQKISNSWTNKFQDLTPHVVILGRAPGFNKCMVDAAIDYAMDSNSP